MLRFISETKECSDISNDMHHTTLLIALFFYHFLGDFTIVGRNAEILKAKTTGSPTDLIFEHATRHMILMFITIVAFFTIFDIQHTTTILRLCFVGSLQLWSHFFIDVMKGKLNVWYPVFADSSKQPHWTAFGIDQLLHAIVIILMVKYVYNG